MQLLYKSETFNYIKNNLPCDREPLILRARRRLLKASLKC